eukprot:6201370-Pleurochrysis_carterae.AAC.1
MRRRDKSLKLLDEQDEEDGATGREQAPRSPWRRSVSSACSSEKNSASQLEASVQAEITALECEQRTLIEAMYAFIAQLDHGVEAATLLCSSEFTSVLGQLADLQQRQRTFLSSPTSKQIREQYPAMLQQSRTLIELLDVVTARRQDSQQEHSALDAGMTSTLPRGEK